MNKVLLILLVICLFAVSTMAQQGCKEDPNLPYCPQDGDIESIDPSVVYCAAYKRGLNQVNLQTDTSQAGVFIQLFPASKCDKLNRSEMESDLFLWKAILGSQFLTYGTTTLGGVKQSEPFKIDLTSAEKLSVSVKGDVDLAKSATYKKSSIIAKGGK